jgi:hypothetical protein
MIPTEDGKWCIYWRPSLFAKRDEAAPAAPAAPAAKATPAAPAAPAAKATPAAPATKATPAAKATPAKATPAKSADKSHRIFSTQEEAIAFAKETLKKRFNRRALKEDEEVTTAEKSMKGLSETNYAKMAPIEGGKWCVYWRPSLVPI